MYLFNFAIRFASGTQHSIFFRFICIKNNNKIQNKKKNGIFVCASSVIEECRNGINRRRTKLIFKNHPKHNTFTSVWCVIHSGRGFVFLCVQFQFNWNSAHSQEYKNVNSEMDFKFYLLLLSVNLLFSRKNCTNTVQVCMWCVLERQI